MQQIFKTGFYSPDSIYRNQPFRRKWIRKTENRIRNVVWLPKYLIVKMSENQAELIT